MTIDEKLRERGATESQIHCKAVELVKEVIAEQSGVVPSAIVDGIEILEKRISEANEKMDRTESFLNSFKVQTLGQVNQLQNAISTAENCLENFQEAIGEMNKTAGDYIVEAKNRKIKDPDVQDALTLYCRILDATQTTFGEENMTEQVMVTAIQAGSYGLWRAIMGGKFKDDSKGPRY